MIECSENMSMEEYARRYDISVRAMNICRSNRLITLDHLKRYFEDYGTFRMLHGCGVMVEKELKEVMKHYNPPPLPAKKELTNEEEALFKQYINLPAFKRSALTNYIIDFLLSGTSIPLGKLFSISATHPFLEKIIGYHTNLNKRYNIDQAIEEEANRLANTLKCLTRWLTNIPDTAGGRKFIELVLQNRLPLQLSDLEQMTGIILDSEGNIKLFALIHQLIYKETVFTSRERKIFQLAYTLQHNPVLAADILAAGLNLTTERIRQLKIAMDCDLDKLFSCIAHLALGDIKNYGFSDTDDLIVIDNERTEEMNQYEDVKFTHSFFARIILRLLERTHDRLFLNKNARGKTKDSVLQKTYLVKREIFRQLDFPRLFEDVHARLKKRVPNEAIDVGTYLMSFLYTSRAKDMIPLRPLCEKILLLEFGLAADEKGCFVF